MMRCERRLMLFFLWGAFDVLPSSSCFGCPLLLLGSPPPRSTFGPLWHFSQPVPESACSVLVIALSTCSLNMEECFIKILE